MVKFGFAKLNRNNRLKTSVVYGFNFSSDGMKLYLPWYDGKGTAALDNIDNLDDDKMFIDQYNLTKAFDLSTLKTKPDSVKVLDVKSLNVKETWYSGQSAIESVTFSNNQRNMYMVNGKEDFIHNYKLNNREKVYSAQRIKNTNIKWQESRGRDIYVKEDGTKLYLIGKECNTVFEYDRNPQTGALKLRAKKDVKSNGKNHESLTFNPKGTMMFVTDGRNRRIAAYTLSTAFDVKTASKDAIATYTVSSDITSYLEDIRFSNDGTKLFILQSYGGINNVGIYEYTLSTPFDLKTVSYKA